MSIHLFELAIYAMRCHKIRASARIKIPNGRLEEYEQLIAEYIRQIKDKDTGTLQFDWFINNDKTTLGG